MFDCILYSNVLFLGYGQLYDAPKTFRSLFLPDKDHVAIQMEPLQRKSSLPHQSGFVSFANSLDASGMNFHLKYHEFWETWNFLLD